MIEGNKFVTRAYAKVNVGLDIVGKTDNGYHLLKSIMQQIDLYDEITVEKVPAGIVLDSDSNEIPLDETNLAYKAAKLMLEEYGIEGGVKIYIKKNIPMAAGMAGGSTDGAAVLIGINEIYGLGLTNAELREKGVRLGADIPFCIYGGAAICEGIGEKLTPLAAVPDMAFVIAKPPIGISTKYVYTHLQLDSVAHPDMDTIIKAYESGDVKTVASKLGNVLESVSEKENEIITSLKNAMLSEGAMGSLMSGSGPTVFGICKDLEAAEKVADRIKSKFGDVFVCAVKPVGL